MLAAAAVQPMCPCWALRGLEPRGQLFGPQRRRGRCGHGDATCTGSPCPSVPLPLSEGGALLGHLGLKKRKKHDHCNYCGISIFGQQVRLHFSTTPLITLQIKLKPD